ncbi:MAG: LytR C-terminal domain-containing protein [Pseudonocardiaceae bacterium]
MAVILITNDNPPTVPPSPTTSALPTTSAPPTPSEPDSGPPTTSGGEVWVYNNSTINGLATRAADDLNAAGWTVVEVANDSGGRIPTTTVYYEEGTDQRATAEAIGTEFGMRVEPRSAAIIDPRPGVIVIVSNDYGS